MWPVLVDVGGFELRTYGVLGALGFLAATWLGLGLAQERGWPRERIIDLIFYGSLCSMLSARLLFVFQNPETVGSWVDVLNPRGLGYVFYGGAFGGVAAFVVLIRRYGLDMADVLDGLGLTAPVAHAVSRLGCFGAGCCHGRPTDLPWGVTFHDPLAAAPLGVPLHPTQLYEAAGLAVLAGGLWAARGRARPGDLFLGWLGGYAALRFVVELFRGDASRGFVGPLSTSQAVALAVGLGVAAAVAWRRR